jgi:DNA polymerase I-like protein with 3'-5' exonuclease and polymerase domains
VASKNYGLITDSDELRQLVGQIKRDGRPWAFDIETGYIGPDKEKAAVRPETAFVVGISFTDSTDWARYVPLGHNTGDNLDNREVAEIFWPLLNAGQGVAHNAQFELRHLSRWFRRWLPDDDQIAQQHGYFPIRSDTMVEAYLAADFERFGLKPLTMLMFNRYGEPVDRSQYLSRIKTIKQISAAFKDEEERKKEIASTFDGHIMTELHELFENMPKNKRKFLRFNTLETDARVVAYACEDSTWCLAIHQHYYPEVSHRTLFPVEIAIVRDVLPEMADEGLVYDWSTMSRTAERLSLFRDRFNGEIMTELSEMLGEPTAVNLASPPQISNILYDRLGYATDVYTDKTRDLPPEQRRMSTGKIALERLAQQYPIVQKIREWKKMTRLLGTYLEKYEKVYRDEHSGRAHGNYLSAFVITGRFAAVDPPVQQSPKKYHFDLAEAKAAHEAGDDPPVGTCFQFNFRDVIVAPPGWYILGFDLSQAELRAIAGEAQEIALLEAFERGDDVHKLTASLMLGVPFEEITSAQRDIGKTMNFALLYGMSTKGLADRLGIGMDEAQELMDKYFAGLPAIAAYMTKMKQHGQTHNYVVSHFGRKLPIWEYTSDKRSIRSKGDRACVNYPIQGCLPSDTHVLTRNGWVEIGQFVDGSDVWTGAEWAPALRLDRGEAPRVRLHLSDGRTFDCDDRHKLLVQGDPWPQWKNVLDAKGLPLCQDRNCDWGRADGSSVEDWYWVGRFVGDGSLFTNSQGYAVWNMSFDGVKEADDVRRFMSWLDSKPFKTTRSRRGYSYDDAALRVGRGKGVKVQGMTPAAVEFWESRGIVLGSKAKDLRVPQQVFQLDRERREAFCEGYLDSDGNARHQGSETFWSKLTSASRAGLEDMLRLFQTVGRTGRIGSAVVLKGRAKDGSDHVYFDLWLHRKVGELTIVDVEIFEPESMYTLSVDHPRHSFSSEGLISKNSATGDYMKIAMIRSCAALRNAGLADKVKLVMNVHDALEFYVHTSIKPEQLIPILQAAVIFPVKNWPSMQADWHIATKWGSPTELAISADGTLVYKGAQASEILSPHLEEDEDGDYVEVLPEVDTDVLKAVVQAAARPVVIRLSTMPREHHWSDFFSHIKSLKTGPIKTIVDTPQGQHTLPFGTRLTPADRDWISASLDDPHLQVVLL